MKMLLNESYELEIRSIERLPDGLDVKMETMSVDLAEETIKKAGSLKNIIFVFESGEIFARYYNLALVSIHKENDTVTIRFKNQAVMASMDVAKELSQLKNLLETYQSNTKESQELQDEAIGELAELLCSLENENKISEEMESVENG